MVGVTALVPPVAQDPAYHHFADQRGLFGVPNFLNVASNLPFLVVGALGLLFLAGDHRGGGPAFIAPEERRPYWPFFTGVALTSVGSAYYHWRPDNATLFWDRLPMTVAFMGLLASVIGERVSRRAGQRLLWPLLIAGVGSTLYWHLGELRGMGDLRPYGLVQFGSMVLVPLILVLFPARYTGTAYLWISLGWYALAKVFEYFDHGLLALTGVSGHTWKHLASAASAYWILRMLARRRPLACGRGPPAARSRSRRGPASEPASDLLPQSLGPAGEDRARHGATARARWLSWSFSSSGSSPNVRPRAGTRKMGSYPNPWVPRGSSVRTPSTVPSTATSSPQGASRARTQRKRARRLGAPGAPPGGASRARRL